MKKELLMLTALLFFFCGTTLADQRTDWSSTSSDPEIQYRSQVYANSGACYIEFRDQKQGRGPTTFDAEVNYRSRDFDSQGQATEKVDRENIVTTASHNGGARISNCSGIIAVRLSFVQRD